MIWHIVLNWKPIVGYMKNRAKQVRILTPELGVATPPAWARTQRGSSRS